MGLQAQEAQRAAMELRVREAFQEAVVSPDRKDDRDHLVCQDKRETPEI